MQSKHIVPVLIGTLVLSAHALAGAPTPVDTPSPGERKATPMAETREIGLLAGLLQPIVVDGGNLQLEATYGRFVFDYSHGWSLDIPTAGAAKDQELALHLPYSTGLGFGYRLTESLDLRFEPKLHKFQVGYASGAGTPSEIASYRTITLGVGAYHRWRPFGKTEGWARGLTVASSLRYWQNAWSSLDGGKVRYEHAGTGRSEVHKVQNIGLANTPIIVNISVGYVFEL